MCLNDPVTPTRYFGACIPSSPHVVHFLRPVFCRHSPDELLWQFFGHYRKGIAEEALGQYEAANASFEKAFKYGELYPWIEPVDLMRVSTACSRNAVRIGNQEAVWKVCLLVWIKLPNQIN